MALGTGGDDLVAFRITLLNPADPATAQLQVDQFRAIQHGNTALYDEQALLTLVSGTLSLHLETTVEDGDGDTSTSTADRTLITNEASPFSFMTMAAAGEITKSVTGAYAQTNVRLRKSSTCRAAWVKTRD